MKTVYNVTKIKNEKIEDHKYKAMKELGNFYNRKWVYGTPQIFIVEDRKTIDDLWERETEDWIVGWSWGTHTIFILNPENITQESRHDGSTYDIYKLIKHELSHSFFSTSFGISNHTWINEGLAIYTADQFDMFSMPKEFNGFLDGKKIYNESGSAIKLLIENFGKDKLFEFLKKQSGVEEEKELKKGI